MQKGTAVKRFAAQTSPAARELMATPPAAEAITRIHAPDYAIRAAQPRSTRRSASNIAIKGPGEGGSGYAQ